MLKAQVSPDNQNLHYCIIKRRFLVIVARLRFHTQIVVLTNNRPCLVISLRVKLDQPFVSSLKGNNDMSAIRVADADIGAAPAFRLGVIAHVPGKVATRIGFLIIAITLRPVPAQEGNGFIIGGVLYDISMP